MLKWGIWLQKSVLTKKERYVSTKGKCTKKDVKWQTNGNLRNITIDESSGSSSAMSNSTGGDVGVSEDYFKERNTEVRPDKDLSFPFRISSQPGNALIIPCPAAAGCCSLQSMSTDTSMTNLVSPSVNFRPSRSSHQAQAQVPQILQGRFASELQQDGRMSAPGYDLPQLECVFTLLLGNLRA